ncbi:phosphoesterase [Falsochrobactrum shanghaiense]|uniref:Phosphoesterase n=2 Tax=Falsochrobactrum shanghaiense TaxID=2201899 RepID=A0A316J868_9HYPH|nr:phosphoesterase [Falsochrobactrum shanghaiense]
MTETKAKDILLHPLRVALQLMHALLKPAYRGAPPSWTIEMTAVIAVLPFILLVLHIWDAEIIRSAMSSEFMLMKLLRSTTDLIRTLVWLGIALAVWLATAWLLSPSVRVGFKERLVRWHGWATLLLLSIVVGSIPLETGKFVIGRARPVLLDEKGAASFTPFAGQHAYESFPSGHSMMAGILLVSLWIFLPRWRIVTMPVCLLFAVSRLAAGAHYPTDIVAGLAIGILAAWWVARFLATRNIIFSLDDEQAFPKV